MEHINENLTLDTTILDAVIPVYAENKMELDSYKKLVDRDNSLIKELMQEADLTEKQVGGWVAKLTKSNRESFNEDKLLEIAHNNNLDEIIKTKEYIDMDLLEDAIYNGKISEDILLEMGKAKEVKEVVTLKVSKVKKGK